MFGSRRAPGVQVGVAAAKGVQRLTTVAVTLEGTAARCLFAALRQVRWAQCLNNLFALRKVPGFSRFSPLGGASPALCSAMPGGPSEIDIEGTSTPIPGSLFPKPFPKGFVKVTHKEKIHAAEEHQTDAENTRQRIRLRSRSRGRRVALIPRDYSVMADRQGASDSIEVQKVYASDEQQNDAADAAHRVRLRSRSRRNRFVLIPRDEDDSEKIRKDDTEESEEDDSEKSEEDDSDESDEDDSDESDENDSEESDEDAEERDEKHRVPTEAVRPVWHGPMMLPWLYDQYAHLNQQRLALDMMWHEHEVIRWRHKMASDMRAAMIAKTGNLKEAMINDI